MKRGRAIFVGLIINFVNWVFNSRFYKKGQWSVAQYYATKVKDRAGESEENKTSVQLSAVSSGGLVKYINHMFLISYQEVSIGG